MKVAMSRSIIRKESAKAQWLGKLLQVLIKVVMHEDFPGALF